MRAGVPPWTVLDDLVSALPAGTKVRVLHTTGGSDVYNYSVNTPDNPSIAGRIDYHQ